MASKYRFDPSQKYGMLKPLYQGKRGGRLAWVCECDCGNRISVLPHCLYRKGTDRQVSCGCKIGLKYEKDGKFVAILALFKQYQRGARRKGHEFCLSKSQAEEFFQSNCYYCGVKPSRALTVRGNGKNKTYAYTFLYNGIDRRDNDKGYLPSNCDPCCTTCNFLKRNMPAEEFEEWCRRIAQVWKDK